MMNHPKESIDNSAEDVSNELKKISPIALEEKVKDILQFADTLRQVEDLELNECERLGVLDIINKQFEMDLQESIQSAPGIEQPNK